MLNKDYDKGYKDGQLDGEKGKGKRLVYRPIKRLIQPDVFLPSFTARFSEYWNAYNQGFEDNKRIHNVRSSDRDIMKNSSESLSEAPKVHSDKIDTSEVDKIIHSVSRVTNQTISDTGGHGAMSNISVDQQIQILEELKSDLNEVKAQLIIAKDKYKEAVVKAYTSGLLVDNVKPLDHSMQETSKVIKSSSESIEINDKKQIAKMIANWENMR